MKTISGAFNTAPDAVTLVDAHHHLWDLSMARHPWLGSHPEPHFFMGDYSPLLKNYLPSDYLADSAGHNVLATVHCEAEWDRDDQVGETRWISAIHARHLNPCQLGRFIKTLACGVIGKPAALQHTQASASQGRCSRHRQIHGQRIGLGMQAQPTHKQHGHFVGLQAPTRPPLRTRGLIGCEILCRNAQGNHGRHGALRLDLNAQSSSQPLCLRLPHLVHRLVHALRGADQRVSDCERPLHVVGDLCQHAR